MSHKTDHGAFTARALPPVSALPSVTFRTGHRPTGPVF